MMFASNMSQATQIDTRQDVPAPPPPRPSDINRSVHPACSSSKLFQTYGFRIFRLIPRHPLWPNHTCRSLVFEPIGVASIYFVHPLNPRHPGDLQQLLSIFRCPNLAIDSLTMYIELSSQPVDSWITDLLTSQ